MILIKKLELWCFILLCGLCLIPVFFGSFFPTMDGAAHLYNSNLINQLLSGNNLANSFFKFNPEPVPNWTSHIILSFFNTFLPAFIAEKIFISAYVFCFSFAFRGLVKTINPNQSLVSFLIFPFIYSFVFLLGFYNFSLGLIFMFITLRFWLLHTDNIYTAKNTFFLSVLILTTYFSHIFVFAILLIILSGYIFYTHLFNHLKSNISIKQSLIYFIKKAFILFLSSIVPLCLFGYYVLKRNDGNENLYLGVKELFYHLFKIQPIIAYNVAIEEVFTKNIFYVFAVLFILLLLNNIIKIYRNLKRASKITFSLIIKEGFVIFTFWVFVPLIILFLYFYLPDSDGSGGFISVRLGLILFIFLIVWFASQNIKKWLVFAAISIVVFYNFKLNYYYTSVISDLNKIATACNNTSKEIDNNSIVLPIDNSNNWLCGHFSNYIAVDKPIVVLENYECGTGYFPLLWNNEQIPNVILGKESSSKNIQTTWQSNKNNTTKSIDYVFVLGNLINKNSDSLLTNYILKEYSLHYKNDYCELYKINGY